MDWLQLSLLAHGTDPDRVGDALSAAGAGAVTLEDAGDQPLYEPPPGAMPLWGDTRVIGLFEAGTDLDAVKTVLREALGGAALEGSEVRSLADRDWVRAWMDDYRPMRFGARLWVCPRHLPPPDPAAVNLLLDPGLAFGTGTHPTTALCLAWLDGAECENATVIDFGCGSGILAIAAALLGAPRVIAVDNDPQALTATRDNAVENAVADRVEVCAPENLPELQADILLANILALPLIELASRFAAHLRSGGSVVLSGILADQVDAVMAAYAADFTMQPPVFRDGWARLVGQRR
jgi:ribosomal protein L11 methyltransferase